jgi:hypothetical protein
MSNVSSDFVFRLVESLDKSEKRYFKLFLNRQGDSKKAHFERIFDALVKQKEYDEEAILEQFDGEPFTKRFSVTKNRLYNHILNALNGYHSNSSVRAKLERSMHHVEILFAKGLYKQCAKILMSVERTAYESDEYGITVEVGNWKRKMDEKSQFNFLSDTDNESINEKTHEALDNLKVAAEVMEAKRKIFSTLYQKGKARSQPESEELSDIKKLMANEAAFESAPLMTQYHYYHSASAYFYHNNDHVRSLEYIIRNIDLIESGDNKKRFEGEELYNLLSNAVFECSRLKKRKEAKQFMERLEALHTSDDKSNQRTHCQNYITLCMTKLAYYHLNEELELALIEMPKIESGLNVKSKHINDMDRAGLLFSMSTIYIQTGRFSEALKLLNRILNSLSINQNEDLFCFAQMLHLITHIELDNKDFLSYAFKSTKRFLLTRKRAHRFESSFLQLVNKLSRAKNSSAEHVALEQFIADMRDIRTDEYERRAFEYFDFLAWAEKKIGQSDADLRISA